MTALPTRAPASFPETARRLPAPAPSTLDEECPDCWWTQDHEVIDDTGTHLILECSRTGCSHRWETPWGEAT